MYLKPGSNPFIQSEFFEALTKSRSVCPETGWEPMEWNHDELKLYGYVKSHSYGEYIFDWSWAEAYERVGLPYYPKFVSMVPFSPVTTPHFTGSQFDSIKALSLHSSFNDFYQKTNLTSAHFLFLPEEEVEFFRSQKYLMRETIQYHFTNDGHADFESFLGGLKGKRAKTIRQERKIPVTIRRFTGSELTSEHAVRMYAYYISTIEHKNSFDYLNSAFFQILFQSLSKNILFVEAYEGEQPIAGSLFLYDEEMLYGRYWGSHKFVEFLHFELCYYQGIDFCLEKKLRGFEAGAQGEHKIARGFRPVVIHSAHKLKEPTFHRAVGDFVEREKIVNRMNREKLSELLPFKK